MLKIDKIYEISTKWFYLKNIGDFEAHSVQIRNLGEIGYRGYLGKIRYNGYYFPNNKISDAELIGAVKGKSFIGDIEYTPRQKYKRRIQTELYVDVYSEDLIKLIEKEDIEGLKNIVWSNCYFY